MPEEQNIEPATDQNDTRQEDPAVFLAKEVLSMKDTLESEIEDLKTQLEEVRIAQEDNRNSVDEIKTMLKEALK